MLKIKRKNGSEITIESFSNNSKYLGIVFSGFGYTYRNPILYYSKRVIIEKGIDYVGVDYKYYEDKEFMEMTEAEQDQQFQDDNEIVMSGIEDLISSYDKVFLIGKSMGTTVAQKCLESEKIRKKAAIVYITPGKEWSRFIPDLVQLENPMLLIGSLEDQYYTVDNLSDIYKKKDLSLCEFKTGNHLLESEDIENDLETLKCILKESETFIDQVLIRHFG